MTTLKPIQLDPDTVIWIETTENVETLAPTPVPSAIGEMVASGTVSSLSDDGSAPVQRRVDKGLGDWISGNGNRAMSGMAQLGTPPISEPGSKKPGLDTTIKSYTRYALQAFRDAAFPEVKRVTLEFGVNLSGMSGVPYIATGTVGCNIKVTVECVLPDRVSHESS